MKNYQPMCADCPELRIVNGKWACHECFSQLLDDLDECPNGLTVEEVQQAMELTDEQKKVVKEATITTSAEKEKKPRKPRTVKENPDKLAVIAEIGKVLEEKFSADVNITNNSREIEFKIGENGYKIILTATRKKKTE